MTEPSRAKQPSDVMVPVNEEQLTPSPDLMRALALITRLAAAILVSLGAAVLFGWGCDIAWLKDPLGGFQHMVPNTALLLALSGLSLWFSRSSSARRRLWLARALAAGCGALALATFMEDLSGRDLGIDMQLFEAHPARPAAPTSIAFGLSSLALLTLEARPRWRPRPAEMLAGGVAAIAGLTLGGYVYGAIQFYVSGRHPHAVGMAIHTATGLLVLATGILAARPVSGVMAVATSPLVGGQVARRMLVITLCIPAAGFFAVRLQQAGVYDPPGAAVVEAVAATFVSVMVTLAVGHSLNLTDARRREKERKVREWQRFFECATFGAAFGTVDGKLERVNEAFASMHGRTIDELVGTPVADVFAAARREELAENIRLTHERGHCRWESEHVRKDGSVFPVLVDLSAIRDEQGKLLYRAAILQDITEEKRAEAVRARLASLVQSASDAIVAKALDGTVLDWNSGAERVYGYSAAEMVGCSILAVVPEDRRAEREAIWERVLSGEVVVGFETVRVRKDERRIPISLTLSPIRDAAGRVVGISTIGRDISREKELEREREEWSAVVAHDLRQPAAVIRLATDLSTRAEGPVRQRALERIRRATDQLDRMVADLLDVSRIEAHRLVVKPELVDVPRLVAEVLDVMPNVASRCHTEVDAAGLRAWTDSGRVVQVLSNLLSNADKYSDPGTPIVVRVEHTGTVVCVSVTNEGPGIGPDEIPKLFSRFARTRSARARGAPGLGLGLYICRGLVEALGGKLWVESIPGDRTHFRFTLPLVTEPEHRLTA